MSSRHRRNTKRRSASVPVRESGTALVAPVAAAPAGRITVAEAGTGGLTPAGGRRYRARLIEGDRWGSSGFYPRTVIERDGPAAWPAGTAMYLDHPTVEEEANRPERSVRDIAAKVVTTPVYEGDGLYADIEVFPHTAPLVEALADTIGLSVRGEGTAVLGEAAGRHGMIIESLDRGYSVDFVTRAGAGGKLVSLIEAARSIAVSEARNVGAWIESRLHLALTELADTMYGDGRLTREERITLSGAVGDALTAFTTRVETDAPQLFRRDLYNDPETVGVAEARRVREAAAQDTTRVLSDLVRDAYGGGQDTYVWVRDFDPDRHLVWFDVNDPTGCDTFQQPYTVADSGQISLTDARVEVVARTDYTPVVTPGDEDIAESAAPPAPAAEPEPNNTPVTEGASPTVPNPTSKEAPMSGSNTGPAPGAAGTAEATIAVAEAEQRVKTVEAERDAALKDADETRRQLARLRAAEAARPIAAAALAETDLPAAAQTRVLAAVVADVPLTEALALDETVFKPRVEEAAKAETVYLAALREAAGEGRVNGLGGTTTAEPTAEQRIKAREAAFRGLGLSETAAKTAAVGSRA